MSHDHAEDDEKVWVMLGLLLKRGELGAYVRNGFIGTTDAPKGRAS